MNIIVIYRSVKYCSAPLESFHIAYSICVWNINSNTGDALGAAVRKKSVILCRRWKSLTLCSCNLHTASPFLFLSLVTFSPAYERFNYELGIQGFFMYILTYSSNKSPTRCNNFPLFYPDVYLQLNMFRAFSRPSSGSQWLQWQPLVLPTYCVDSRAVFVAGPAGRPARPPTQHDCHHDTKVKPEAATAVIELLMMGGKTPETCWAVNYTI